MIPAVAFSVYEIYFADGKVYTGVTRHPSRRWSEHQRSKKLGQRIVDLRGRFVVVKCGMPAREAGEYEATLIEQRKRAGTTLNEVKGGFTGRGIEIYTLQRCMGSASGHVSPIDWKRADPGAYCAALKRGWKDACTEHMVGRRRRRPISLEDAVQRMARFSCRSDFKAGDPECYRFCAKEGWLDAAFSPRALPRRLVL